MEKRQLGKIKEEISLLGFGAMRLPRRDGDYDLPELKAMLDTAMAGGVNYYDTAYIYDNGNSEKILGELLVDRYPRERFYLADKLPGWRLPKGGGPAEMRAILEESLERLHTDYLDFYLVHSLSGESWAKLVEKGVKDFLAELRESGKARYIGFSFHDAPESLPGIVAAFPWDFAQIQLNYLDWDGEQQARAQYDYLTAQGVPVVVMEPVRGGSLAQLPPDALSELEGVAASAPALLALRFAASQANVLTVLSGMSSRAQVAENCQGFRDFQPLSAAEQQAISRVLARLNERELVLCTGCRYCEADCPRKINISAAMNGLNHYLTLPNRAALNNYIRQIKPGQQPQDCLGCGVCQTHCPQKIDIPQHLADLAKALAENGF